MIKSLTAYFFIISIVLLIFVLQYRLISLRRDRLKLRILVNGTRGKSSVTRLIAGGLRYGLNQNILAKTTGTAPMWVYPDGTERLIKRSAPANIKEMGDGLKIAGDIGASVYVAECMAIKGEYQRAIEKYWMRSNITVITNIRPDHEDELGDTIHEISTALSESLPINGLVVTGSESAPLIRSVSDFPEDKIITVDSSFVKNEWLDLFNYPVFTENLALALKVCELAGVKPEVAVKGMALSKHDPGNTTENKIIYNGKTLHFIQAFAANDPVSVEILARKYPPGDKSVRCIWINGRKDRRQRSVSLIRSFKTYSPDFLIFSGDNTFLRKQIIKLYPGVTVCPIKNIKAPSAELEKILSIIKSNDIWILATGNTAGLTIQTLQGNILCRK